MAVTVEKSLLMALGGHLTENTKLPSPRIIKIYVASCKEGKYNFI